MKFVGLEDLSECRSRRKEALIHHGPSEQPGMESPYVVSYKIWI
jgi:hypothetical protein